MPKLLSSIFPLPLALWIAGLTQGHHPHGPPPEAYEACTSKAVGDACTVSFHGSSLGGTCKAPQSGASDTRLFCMPTDGDGGAPPGPPPNNGERARRD